MVYAGFWRRWLAHVIDCVITTIAMIIILVPIGLVFGGVMAGQDLIGAAEKRKASQSGPQTQLHTVQRIIPLAESVTYTQPAPGEMTTYPTAPTTNTVPQVPVQPAPPPAYPVQPTYEAAPPATVAAPMATESGTIEYHGTGIFKEEDPAKTATEAIINLIASTLGLAIGLFYHPLFTAGKWQATPGKRLMGCAVVTRDGQRLTYAHAFGRHLACILSWLPFPPLCIGFYLAGWTREKTALHDMIASTRVVLVEQRVPTIATR